MAHTITGIDLGSWAVKFTVLEVGFRHTRVASTFEERVAVDERPLVERQYEALRQGPARLPGETTAYLALPGDMLTLRVLELPFADARKIDQVVGYEMEGQIIHELNDVILDHVVLSARGQVDEGDAGCRALVVAARIEEVRAFLAAMKGCNVDPRSLYVAPSAVPAAEPRGRHRRQSARVPRRSRTSDTVAPIFASSSATRPCSRARFSTGARPSPRDLCARRRAPGPGSRPSRARRRSASWPAAGRPAATNVEVNVDTIVREALQPLPARSAPDPDQLRDQGQGARGRDPADRRRLAARGFGGLPRGRAGHSRASRCSHPPKPRRGRTGFPSRSKRTEPEADRFVLASTIADIAARGHKQFDLRRGEFQYRASFSIVRQRASHLMVLAASLLVCVGIHATMTLRRLSAEQRVLKAQLQTATKELFGETRMEATDVTAALKRSFRDEMAPLPKATAYDLLDDISSHIPSADKVKIDIEDLDIKPKKTTIKGTIDSAAAVDEIVAKLKGVECFEDISKGPITEVSGGAKQFSLTIASKCP